MKNNKKVVKSTAEEINDAHIEKLLQMRRKMLGCIGEEEVRELTKVILDEMTEIEERDPYDPTKRRIKPLLMSNYPESEEGTANAFKDGTICIFAEERLATLALACAIEIATVEDEMCSRYWDQVFGGLFEDTISVGGLVNEDNLQYEDGVVYEENEDEDGDEEPIKAKRILN